MIGATCWLNVIGTLRPRSGGSLLKDERAHDDGDTGQQPASPKLQAKAVNESLTHHWELRHKV